MSPVLAKAPINRLTWVYFLGTAGLTSGDAVDDERMRTRSTNRSESP